MRSSFLVLISGGLLVAGLAAAAPAPQEPPASAPKPMPAHEAEDELRNVAGSQLDGRLVWLFATQVLRGRHSDHLEHIADLEAELQVQRAVRGALDGPFVLGPPMR
jgi:hypothetical protein